MKDFSTKHLMFLVLGTCIISVTSYSSIFIRKGYVDTWLFSVISALLFTLFFIYFLKICAKKNISNSAHIFSNVYLYIFSIGLILVSIESASCFSSSIHTNYFLRTPLWYCLLFIIVPAGYVLTKNINSVLIVTMITVGITFALYSIFLILCMFKAEFSSLLPILSGGLQKNSILCILSLIGSLSSVMIIFPYAPYFDCKHNLIKNITLAFLFCLILMVLSFISVTTILGENLTSNIFYPEYVLSQNIHISNFIEYGQLVFIFKSVSMFFIKYILSSYAIILLFKNKITNKSRFILIYSVVIFIFSYLLSKNQYILFNSLEIMQYIWIVTFIAAPFLSLKMSKI